METHTAMDRAYKKLSKLARVRAIAESLEHSCRTYDIIGHASYQEELSTCQSLSQRTSMYPLLATDNKRYRELATFVSGYVRVPVVVPLLL